MIIISDAHINESIGNHVEFFQMLNLLENCDEDIIFLGDIFDLWIALPRYERDIHQRFLAWCTKQKRNRHIGFIEGNHEYFLADERADCFSWCSDKSCKDDGKSHLFCHGDQVNRKDRNYLWFRKIVKNRVMKTYLRFAPYGPVIVEKVKRRLKFTNDEFRQRLPEDELKLFAHDQFSSGYQFIFVGHFHRAKCFKGTDDRRLYTVPGWFEQGQITHFEEQSGKVKHFVWPVLSEKWHH